jgi:hypothetical protein
MNQNSLLDERKPVRQAKSPETGNVALHVKGVRGGILVRWPVLNFMMHCTKHVAYQPDVARGCGAEPLAVRPRTAKNVSKVKLPEAPRSALSKWNEEVRPLLFSKNAANTLFATHDRICFKTIQNLELSKMFQY